MSAITEFRGARVSLADKLTIWRAQWAEFKRRNEIRNRTYRELVALSDRDLADLGISRFDIRAIADDAARAA